MLIFQRYDKFNDIPLNHCSKIIDISKGKLLSTIGQHYQSVPPIEEAFNSLQQFLQEDFPKLIRDIHYSAPNTISEENDFADERLSTSSTDSDDQVCGSFSVLPVKYISTLGMYRFKINVSLISYF